jgi:hypothetical protein
MNRIATRFFRHFFSLEFARRSIETVKKEKVACLEQKINLAHATFLDHKTSRFPFCRGLFGVGSA